MRTTRRPRCTLAGAIEIGHGSVLPVDCGSGHNLAILLRFRFFRKNHRANSNTARWQGPDRPGRFSAQWPLSEVHQSLGQEFNLVDSERMAAICWLPVSLTNSMFRWPLLQYGSPGPPNQQSGHPRHHLAPFQRRASRRFLPHDFQVMQSRHICHLQVVSVFETGITSPA